MQNDSRGVLGDGSSPQSRDRRRGLGGAGLAGQAGALEIKSSDVRFQSYPEFQYIRVGAVYTAIPIGGLITLLFVIEKALGLAPAPEPVHGEEAP